jgi:hypothetical protein
MRLEEKSDTKLKASGRLKDQRRIVEAQSRTFIRMINRAGWNERRLNNNSQRRDPDSIDISCRLHKGRVY